MFWLGVVVRTDGDPMRLVDPIRAELARLDPEVPMADVRTMEARLADDVAPQRFALSLVGVFALIALVLAVLGIHSVISWNVAQRRREIGIRIAIGASRAAVVRAVAGRGVLAACLGVMVGLLAAVIGSRFLADLLYGVDDGQSRLFLSGSIALLSMTMVAAYVPARKAADVDPASTLRAE